MFEAVAPSVQFVIKLAVGLGVSALAVALVWSLVRNVRDEILERRRVRQYKDQPPPFNWWAELRHKMGWPEGYIIPGGPHDALSFMSIPFAMCAMLDRIKMLEDQMSDLQARDRVAIRLLAEGLAISASGPRTCEPALAKAIEAQAIMDQAP